MSDLSRDSIANQASAVRQFGDRQTDIAALHEEAKQFISTIEAVIKLDGEKAEQVCEEALEGLSEIGDKLTQCPSKRLYDIVRKICVWRALTQEASRLTEDLPVDERLLGSIMGDVENLAATTNS